MKALTTLYKNAYSGLAPSTWWLSTVMLVNRSGTMVLPFMTLYLTQSKHYSIASASIVMAFFGLGAVCGGILGGKLTDKFGFYNVQLAALLSGGVMFLVLGQVQDFNMICACTFLLSMMNDAFRPANATAVAHYSNEENRTRCYSLNRLAVNLGWAVGGTLGGIIAAHDYQLLFWIDGLTNIFAAILLRAVLSPSKNSATPKHQKAESSTNSSAYKDKPYMVFFLLTILFGMCFFQLFATQPVFFKQALGLTPVDIGLIMALNGSIIAIVEMPLVFTLEQRRNYMRFIVIGVSLVSASFMVFNVLPGAMALALFSTLIITVGEMMSMPFMNTFWTSRTNAANRGQYAGLYTAAWSIAQIFGPFAGGLIADRYGFHALWWSVGGTAIVCALGFAWLDHRTRADKALQIN